MTKTQSDLSAEIARLKRDGSKKFRAHLAQVTILYTEIAALKRKEFPAFDELRRALQEMQRPQVDNDLAAKAAQGEVIAAAFKVVGIVA